MCLCDYVIYMIILLSLATKKFQKIVNQTITPQLLKWKGVEATQEIARSENAKVIVIGNGDGDLPIILGGQ